jgi:hypothetical protein
MKMFKQRRKNKTHIKRLTSCAHPKHLFAKNKGKCLCGNYYKDNGRLLREKGAFFVAGTTADFRYKGRESAKQAESHESQKMEN